MIYRRTIQGREGYMEEEFEGEPGEIIKLLEVVERQDRERDCDLICQARNNKPEMNI